MRIIAGFFTITAFIAFLWTWELFKDTRILNNEIKRANEEVSGINSELEGLLKYKNGTGQPLAKFYLGVFNDIKEICSYYDTASEIKIVSGKDLTNVEEFFNESQYRGIKYVDVLCRFGLKSLDEVHLFYVLYETVKREPIRILDVRIENNTVVLTMRLYGL